MPTLAASLGAESDHFIEVAQAILTTDTVEKTAFARLEVAGTDARRWRFASPLSARARE